MQSNNRKKRVKIAVIAGAVVIVAAVGVVVLTRRFASPMATGRQTTAESTKSYEVKKGTISTTVSGTGTLTADDTVDIDLLSLMEVDTVYVEAGDTVQEGDLLATVNAVSVRTALKTLQDELESLDDKIQDEKDETISSKVKAGVSGRVKKLYGVKGDSVAAVMQENGALALLSLDGKMAVDIDSSASLAVGDGVTVTLEDGSTEEGTVEAISGTKATVTVTDNGPEYGEKVTVSKDGTTLGDGELYIHSELAVTGYAGTISSVSVEENDKVNSGAVLFKLTDLTHTAEYEKLVAERAEVAEALSQAVVLYNNPNLYAEFSGTVQSVNCENAEYVSLKEEEETDSEKGLATDKTEDSSEEADDKEDRSGRESSNKENSGNRQTGMAAADGGFMQLKAAAGAGVRQMSAVAGASDTGTETGESGTTDSPEDSQAPSGDTGNGETSGGKTEGETGSGTETDSGAETDSSAGTGSETDGNGGTDAGEEKDEAIAALQPITITAPVSGGSIQKTVADASQYSASIGWNPAVTGTYSANTAYTATVILKAKDGYCFDGTRISAYAGAVAAEGAGVKAEVSSDGKTLTVTAAFAATAAEETQTDMTGSADALNSGANAAFGKMAAAGGSISRASVSGYSTSSLAGTSAASEQEENLNEYTDSTAVFTVSTDEKMCVSITVDEQDILKLSEGQQAQVTLDAVEGETFEGTVTDIHTASGDAANGVTKYTADVTVDKTENMLQGMNASVVVTISSAEDCLMIPEAALNENGKTTTVYTSYNESTGEYGGETEVTTGVSDGTSVEILSGLSEGDTVYYSYTEGSDSGSFGFEGMMGGQEMPQDMEHRQRNANGGGGRPDFNGQ